MFLLQLLLAVPFFMVGMFGPNIQINANSNDYILSTANTSVWLSGASYCGKEQYMQMQLSGPGKGFIVSDILYDSRSDLQGYVGVLPSSKSIFVTFRGSSSVLNWLDDFEVLKIPYTTYPSCNCSVHKGFYKATLSLKESTITAIQTLFNKYPDYKQLFFTGHSLGAAITQLMAMEMMIYFSEKMIIDDITVTIYNFGQPRVGDNKYAGFVNTIIDEDHFFRFTHYKDTVPHVPPIEMSYLHSCREIFEDEVGQLHSCSMVNCEDPMCSDQFSFTQTNTDDHSVYLGHYLTCKDSTIMV